MARTDGEAMAQGQVIGRVVKLDRGYPLVQLEDGALVRGRHATDLVKNAQMRAVIGDMVAVDAQGDCDKAIIARILPRSREFIRKDPTERTLPQVLAANFDLVIVAHPIAELNVRRLERELVLAHETGAAVAVVLTKCDLADSTQVVLDVQALVTALVSADVPVIAVSDKDPASVEDVRALVPTGTMAVLIGRSGVGKSSLVNLIVGSDVAQTSAVRESDGKGRHTTVSREIVPVPGGGELVDMPGVRGLGMWEADGGIDAAFADVSALAQSCKYRDCLHQNEPGCAVRAAVEQGMLSKQRWESYLHLKQETRTVRERKRQASWKNKPGKKKR